jgi:UDP:flavonoid glycosyltransferase YjiC (YdhE family)
MSKTANYKIVFLVVPYSGHVNCMLNLAYELVHNRNVHLIFYGIETHRQQIESTGAEYRPYLNYPEHYLKRKAESEETQHIIIQIMNRYIDVSYNLIPDLIQMVNIEQPDCIVYDSFTVYAKYLRLILINKQKAAASVEFKMPKFVSFSSVFAMRDGTFPTHEEKVLNNKILTERDEADICLLNKRQAEFNKVFGLSIEKTMEFLAQIQPGVPNIVAVVPDIQPRAYFFARTHKFVGFCINERFRPVSRADSRKLDSLLKRFNVINPSYALPHVIKDSNEKLVYVALGTLFNENMDIYERILQTVQLIDESRELYFVVATGDSIYSKLEALVANNKLVLSDRVVLVPFAPQIEFLKRASLFITHSGLNSTSEAIYFGVPMICLPIQADQPLVAMRMEELGIGKRLDYKSFDKYQMLKAIEDLMSDGRYVENVIKYSKLSREYDGSSRAADIILDHLQN